MLLDLFDRAIVFIVLPAIALATIAGIAWLVVVARAESRRATEHGGCVEWRATGALDCYGSETYKRCEPAKECVRYADGTQP
jgi:hypothetical protein